MLRELVEIDSLIISRFGATGPFFFCWHHNKRAGSVTL
jgi:hypothetical protein